MPQYLSLFNVFITQRYLCSMENVDFDVGNDDWKALDIPKFETGDECRDWCDTQPGANAFVWVEDNNLCFAKTGDVKIKPVPGGLTTLGGKLPCP